MFPKSLVIFDLDMHFDAEKFDEQADFLLEQLEHHFTQLCSLGYRTDKFLFEGGARYEELTRALVRNRAGLGGCEQDWVDQRR